MGSHTRRFELFALGTLIVVSAVLHWLAVRRFDGLWILPDEGVYSARAVDLWHHGTLGGGYGVLYPLVAGVPLSAGSVAHGLAALKVVQTFVMSLAAVPVFVFGRRLMPARYALLAAALSLASPLLLYSGLVMTEVLFYPVGVAAVLALAHAVAKATVRSQLAALAAVLLAVLTRPQAVVLVGVLAAAAALDAAFAREPARLRRFWPTWAVLGLAAVALATVPSLVGSYAGTLRGAYPFAAGLRLSYEHLAFLAVATALIPLAATALLAAHASLGRERDPTARAFLAVCVCSCVLLPVQVGFYAARYAPHLLGRDLAVIPPLLFLTFALWLARGAPRPLVSGPLAAFGVLALVLLAPWNGLVVQDAFADSFDLLLIARARGHEPVNVVVVAALILLGVFAVVPRRALIVSAVVVGGLLVGASVVAAHAVRPAVGAAQANLGPDRSWIDHAAHGDVGYVYGGSQFWNVVWQERFWNRRIDVIYAIEPNVVAGPIEQTGIRVRRGGRLSIAQPYVVAADRLSFVGAPVAHLAQEGLDVSGLTLWRLQRPARVSTAVSGVQPNGDMTSNATVTAYDCAGGRLDLTLLPKATDVLRVLLDGRVVLRRRIGGRDAWQGSITVPATRRRSDCTFTIIPTPLLGSTRIAFVRR